MRQQVLLLAVSVWLSGCQMAVARVGEPPPTVRNHTQERAYQDIFDHFTAHQQVYRHLDTQMFGGMTYQSWPFRKARVEREALFKALPAPDVESMLLTERGAYDKAHEFFFGVHMNDRRYDDFDRPDTIWRIALVAGNQETTPILVERVGRSSLPLRAYYSYLDDFWVGYWVRFPREVKGIPVIPPGVDQIKVVVASTLGKAEFTFPTE